ncbi:hypothetical protein [Actinoplanes sp. ATCC 53533]|nr:hypothetical protein [Actinoplanes sp. ATCC 53533]
MQPISRDDLRALLGVGSVRVYEGGKTDWAAAGLPFEGSRTATGVTR